ncbi:MAG: hypothetical protein GY816_07740, partial [Cytophagales bacterium]|nr:hypothetical protein [Cytophagales bacterium]
MLIGIGASSLLSLAIPFEPISILDHSGGSGLSILIYLWSHQNDFGIVLDHCKNLRHILIKGRPCDEFLVSLATHKGSYDLHHVEIQDASNLSPRAWSQFFGQDILQTKTKPEIQLRNLTLIKGPITYDIPYKKMVQHA